MRKQIVRYLLVAVVITAVTGLILLLPLTKIQAALFAPGNGVHDGKVGCTACHSPVGPTALSCINIACHPLLPTTFKTAASYQFHRQAKQACTVCHLEHAGSEDTYASRPFSHTLFPPGSGQTCATCHTSPKDLVHTVIPAGTGCQECHTTSTWQGANFDHGHLAQGQLNNCVGCHAAPRDQEHSLVSSQCASCHRTSTWKPAGFAHQDLTAQGKSACATCHQPPQDRDHSLVSNQCAACHQTTAWRPAAFTHQALSAKGWVSCGLCHAAPGDDHPEVGLDCGRCHSTQSWGDD